MLTNNLHDTLSLPSLQKHVPECNYRNLITFVLNILREHINSTDYDKRNKCWNAMNFTFTPYLTLLSYLNNEKYTDDELLLFFNINKFLQGDITPIIEMFMGKNYIHRVHSKVNKMWRGFDFSYTREQFNRTIYLHNIKRTFYLTLFI